mmetsp:Transcript_28317/g.34553  ORF Transcript_28317/g.34553 Transcript_28317/m.34553 type:complete len:96 (-) Transcript_28317:213-500(-)
MLCFFAALNETCFKESLHCFVSQRRQQQKKEKRAKHGSFSLKRKQDYIMQLLQPILSHHPLVNGNLKTHLSTPAGIYSLTLRSSREINHPPYSKF